jgi:hypothetical protein
MLIQPSGSGYRFFHDSVREALLVGLEPDELRSIHQKLAEALDQEGAVSEFPISLDLIDSDASGSRAALETYRVANHYADGMLEKTPRRTLEICLRAGDLAFHAFDNDLALRFYDVARSPASHGQKCKSTSTARGTRCSPDFALWTHNHRLVPSRASCVARGPGWFGSSFQRDLPTPSLRSGCRCSVRSGSQARGEHRQTQPATANGADQSSAS